MKTKTAKTSKATKATDPIMTGAEPELGNAQGITINSSTEVVKTEEARQAEMKGNLAKVKAGEKRMKASVKAAKKATSKPAAKKAATPAKKAAKPAKATKPAKKAKATLGERGTTKKDQVMAMISRKNGATLDEIMATMGWQRHTVRGFIAILGKKGTKIESFKSDKGDRTYKAA